MSPAMAPEQFHWSSGVMAGVAVVAVGERVRSRRGKKGSESRKGPWSVCTE